MKYIFLLIILASIGCRVEAGDVSSAEGIKNDVKTSDYSDYQKSMNYSDCVTETIMTDNIPLNFILDIDCPPYIIDSPHHLIHPKDPGPK